MPKVIAISGTKGGIGKTTLTSNLGGMLADLGKKVLLVDADSQPALTDYYELEYPLANYGLVDIFKQPSLVTQAISKTSIGCDIIVSNDDERNIETALQKAGVSDIKYRLNKAVSDNIKHLEYDYVIIDCPGVTSTIHKAAILAADLILCPVTPDHMSIREFPRGTLAMIKSIEKDIEEQVVPWKELAPVYCLVYRRENTVDSDAHTRVLQEGMPGLYEQLKRQVDNPDLSHEERNIAMDILKNHDFMPNSGFKTLDAIVPRQVVYQNATSMKQPVHRIEKSKNRNSAVYVFKRLLRELPLGLTEDELNSVESVSGGLS